MDKSAETQEASSDQVSSTAEANEPPETPPTVVLVDDDAHKIGRIKEPPVCSDDTLRSESMSTEQLRALVFSVKSQSSVVSSSSSESEEKYLNEKVAARKTSRQGRLLQRWGEKEGKKTRLVTGCVPILKDSHILFVSASRKAQWILPKGGWEQDESMEESAIRECFEEAGCLGTLGPPLTTITYETRKAAEKRTKKPRTEGDPVEKPAYSHVQMTLFPLYVNCIVDRWPEQGRFRKAIPIETAIEVLDHRQEFRAALQEVKSKELYLHKQE